MTVRIAIVDERIPNQADHYRPDLHVWVVGARQTLRVGDSDSPARMVQWVSTQARQLGGNVTLDLISHGAGADHLGNRVFYVKLGSPGITPLNVGLWSPVAGLLRKIRVYCCGTLSPAYGDHVFRDPIEAARRSRFGGVATAPPRLSPVDSQHQLMSALAQTTETEVKYSLNTMVGEVEARSASQSFDPDPMLAPVFVVQPNGIRRQVR